MNTAISSSGAARQHGAVLVVALMFLVVLTLLGISSMSNTTLEERMAGNSRSQSLAFQAAEAALRDAERDLWGVGTAPFTPRPFVISGKTGFGSGAGDADNGTCNDGTTIPGGITVWPTFGQGLCRARDSGPIPRFPLASLDPTSSVAVRYGQYTGATPLIGISTEFQPRYIIEALCSLPPPPGTSFGSSLCYHRITSRGFGASASSVVTLQEVYLKPTL